MDPRERFLLPRLYTAACLAKQTLVHMSASRGFVADVWVYISEKKNKDMLSSKCSSALECSTQ